MVSKCRVYIVMKKLINWFKTNPGETPSLVGTVFEITDTKAIVQVNNMQVAYPIPEGMAMEVFDRVLVDGEMKSIVKVIPHSDIAPIGTLYDSTRNNYPFTMDDIAGIQSIKDRIIDEICLPFLSSTHAGLAEKLKYIPPKGLLLEGPPGCGKTMLASAIAHYMKLPILVISGSDIVRSLIGESSINISKVFRYCRSHSPIVLFIDEIESIAPKRGQERESGEIDRLYTQLLLEIDGLNSQNKSPKKAKISDNNAVSAESSKVRNSDSRAVEIDAEKENAEKNLEKILEKNSENKEDIKNFSNNSILDHFIFVIGATNRKNLIDPAILRPGRLDIHISVPLPDEQSRLLIIEKMMSGVKNNINFSEAAMETKGFSGADLKRFVQLMKVQAIKEKVDTINQNHMLEALQKINVSENNSNLNLEITDKISKSLKGKINTSNLKLFFKHFGKYMKK